VIATNPAGTVIAAGTSTVGQLAPGQKADYNGLFVGNPKGAAISAFAPVTNVAGYGAPAQ
jgi:hypothetical protein